MKYNRGMDTDNPKNELLRIDLDVLFAIALFASMPLYSPNVMPFSLLAGDLVNVGSFVLPMMAACIAVSGALFISSHLSMVRRAVERREAVPTCFPESKPLRWAALVFSPLYVVSTGSFYCMAEGLIGFDPLAASIAGAVSGISLVFVLIAWKDSFSGYGVRRALLGACIVVGSSAAINWLASYLPAVPLLALSCLLLVLGTAPVVCRALVRPASVVSETGSRTEEPTDRQAERIAGASCEEPSSQTSPNRSEAVPEQDGISPFAAFTCISKRFVSVLFPAFLGLALFAFFMGVAPLKVYGIANVEVAGNLVAALLLAPLCFVRFKQPPLHFLYETVLPVAAVAIMLLQALPYGLIGGREILYIAVYVFFGITALLSLALGVASANAREFPDRLVYAGLIFAFSLSSLGGLLVGSVHASAFLTNAVSLFVVSLYCTYLAVSPIVQHTRRDLTDKSEAEREEGPSKSPADAYRERCRETSERFRLSPREREIMAYMGRGHSSVYIAKTLVISENTVYTHARNIYRKIGIGSKEQLIQLLSETPAESEGEARI